MRRLTPDLRLHREVHIYDPNIGTRDRLPLCDSNPNQVKETEKGPGVAEVTGTLILTGLKKGGKENVSAFDEQSRTLYQKRNQRKEKKSKGEKTESNRKMKP